MLTLFLFLTLYGLVKVVYVGRLTSTTVCYGEEALVSIAMVGIELYAINVSCSIGN